MVTIIPSGSHYCFNNLCGVYFWGAHGHDAIWHLGVAAVSFNHFPFIAPTFAGATLGSYNYLLDLVLFIFSKIGVSVMVLYFKILPVVWFGLLTYLLLKLSRKIHDSALFVFIFLFFMYFSGSFSYVISFIHNRTIWGSSGLLSMQPLLSLTNLQFAFSIAILSSLLILIKNEKTDYVHSVLLSILVVLNLALKFYAGVISFFLVALYFTFVVFKSKRIASYFKNISLLIVLSLIVIILFYRPGNLSTGGPPLIYSPFSTVYPLIEDRNLFYLKDMTNARYFLDNLDKFSPRLLIINVKILSLFLLLNFGTRIIGIVYIGIQIFTKKLSQFELIVFLTTVFTMLLNILFIQKGVWWNTVQFSYYAFFLSNIFAAQFIYMIFKKSRLFGVLLTCFVIVLTVPTSLDVIKTFTERPGHTYLPREEEKALKFLKRQPEGIVFSPLPSGTNNQSSKQTPLSSLGDSSYITAFSGKQSFIADEIQLLLTGVNYQKRKISGQSWNCTTIRKVRYLYELNNSPIGDKLDACKGELKRIYSNSTVTIYRVSQF